MVGRKSKIIEFNNTETHHCVITESILRNILKDWEKKWELKYKIKANKVEKVSQLLSLFGIDLTLWIAYITAEFTSEYVKAVIFVASIVGTIFVVYVAIKTYKAYQVEEETLDIESLIKDIEKRTE